MNYQGIRLPCKNYQGHCDPTTRTQATIVWFPEDTCTTFQVAKKHARMIKFHAKYFSESIPYEQVNPPHKQSTDFKNIHDIENKLTHLFKSSFQIFSLLFKSITKQNLHVNIAIHFIKHNTLKYLSNTKKVST